MTPASMKCATRTARTWTRFPPITPYSWSTSPATCKPVIAPCSRRSESPPTPPTRKAAKSSVNPAARDPTGISKKWPNYLWSRSSQLQPREGHDHVGARNALLCRRRYHHSPGRCLRCRGGQLLESMAKAGKLPIDVVSYSMYKGVKDALFNVIARGWQNSCSFRLGGVKLAVEGSIQGYTA
jgi:hypothetical protein